MGDNVVKSTTRSENSHFIDDVTDLEEMAISTNIAQEKLDCGKSRYLKICEELKIAPDQKIVNGLKGRELELRYRGIGATGAAALASALIHNTTIKKLNIEENGLEGEGCVYIAEMLQQNPYIAHVNLSKNNIGTIGAIALGNMIMINSGITHLDISHNQLRDADASYVALGIERNDVMTHLNVSHNLFSEEGASVLSRSLGVNKRLEQIDLSWNQIRRKGAVALCNSIKHNMYITSANLAWNGFGYEGAVGVGDMLGTNKHLSELDISNNRINWNGAMVIASGLKRNQSLQVLRIGHNPLTMTGCLDILESIDNWTSVTSHIGFDGIPVNRRAIFTMQNIQKKREFEMRHGGLLESEDVFGRRVNHRCDPFKVIIQFLTERGIRPVDLFRTFDKDNQHRVSRDQFIQGLKRARVPLDNYELQLVINRLDSGNEGKISYQRLMTGFKQQIKVNREEEKKKNMEDTKRKEERKRIMTQASNLPPITESQSMIATSSIRYRSAGSVRSISTATTAHPHSLVSYDVTGSRTCVLSKSTFQGQPHSGSRTCVLSKGTLQGHVHGEEKSWNILSRLKRL